MTKKTSRSKPKKGHPKKTKKQKKALNKSFLFALLILLTLPFAGFFGYEFFKKDILPNFSPKQKAKSQYVGDELINKMKTLLKEERSNSARYNFPREKQKTTKQTLKTEDIYTHRVSKVEPQEKKKTKIEVVAYPSEIEDFKKSGKENLVDKKEVIKKAVIKTNKPLLAIIIDDMAYDSHVKELKALPYEITPSFFPPSPHHPNTEKYAKKFDFYMIHLPLEAMSFIHPERSTLLVKNSKQEMNKRIKQIRKWFPKASFINNHTGSKFTSNYGAMKKLYASMIDNSFVFIDSRTTRDTVSSKVAKELNQNVLSRDVFLDNKADVKYIRGQLKEAVRIAKDHGYAIAIGHPRKKTFQALKNSSDLLKSVKVVYAGKIYEKAFDGSYGFASKKSSFR